MEFTSFLNLIIHGVQQKFGAEYQIEVQNVAKNNGVQRTGIVARKENMNSFPTVYLNEYYREDLDGDDCEKIAQMVYERIKEAELSEPVDMSVFSDFQKAKKQIGFKLVNTEKNEALLKEIPHREFFNLSMVYFYLMPEEHFEGRATVSIKNHHMKTWKIKEEELYQVAYENTPVLFPSKIDSMQNFMKDLPAKNMMQNDVPMFILSNEQRLFGASCMLYPGELESFARLLDSNLYILPSSVHEIIIVPERPGMNTKLFLKVVVAVNYSQVEEEEILADSVFFYNKKEESLYLLDNF